MDWFFISIFSIYQATWVRFIFWIIFDNLTIAYRMEYVFNI